MPFTRPTHVAVRFSQHIQPRAVTTPPSGNASRPTRPKDLASKTVRGSHPITRVPHPSRGSPRPGTQCACRHDSPSRCSHPARASPSARSSRAAHKRARTRWGSARTGLRPLWAPGRRCSHLGPLEGARESARRALCQWLLVQSGPRTRVPTGSITRTT
ncbi:hypothetical protein BD413DRAFT_502854 [Trametes elegans]|nr:hypothetical protein BD413DRAFT_502854 [Trametes elegans]